MNTQRHTNATKTAIGYVRVSTQEQAIEGVSLDAQRDKLRAYCKANAIKLIDIKADEAYSGSSLDRPGLQAALHLLRRGRVNTLIVVKLDRLSRSLRDVCTLVEELRIGLLNGRFAIPPCQGLGLPGALQAADSVDYVKLRIVYVAN